MLPARPNPNPCRAVAGAFLNGWKKSRPAKASIIREVDVAGIGSVAGAIEDAGGIAGPPVEQVAVQLETHIAVRHQVGHQRPLVEEDVPVRLQLFQPDGHLEFARLELQRGAVAVIEVGIKDRRAAARREIRHEQEIEVPEDRALQDRPHPPQQQAVIAHHRRVVEESP
jgi:hypothetical protein